MRVFVRHCATPSTSKPRPPWFDRAALLRQLVRTARGAQVTIWFDDPTCDAPPPRGTPEGVRIERGEFGSEAASMAALVRRVARDPLIPDDCIVYLAEDDYLHLPGWPEALESVFDGWTAPDYATLYDHPDKYDGTPASLPQYAGLRTVLNVRGGRHWREAPSTTNSFACLAKTLRETLDVHLAHYDLRTGVSHDHECFRALAARGRVLWSALPALATHCEPDVLSPGVDWAAEAGSCERVV